MIDLEALRQLQDQQQQQLQQQTTSLPRAIDDKESLSVVLQPVYDQSITGVFSFVESGKGQFTMNGRINKLPLLQQVEVKLMKYGDLSSLAVEYPDYNSLGQSIMTLDSTTSTLVTSEAYKVQKTLQYPESITKMSDLAGRAIIISWEKDLLAYGILVNETRLADNSSLDTSYLTRSANSVAVCENLLSTVSYRAIFQIKQTGDKVTFDGLLRTSDKMEDEYELILSLNHRKTFDLDFKKAYQTGDLRSYDEVMHPCYVITEEQVESQDWLLGRDLNMYGSHEDFDIQILEQSKCHIGIQNPDFRISDERFCQTILDKATLMGQSDRKYTVTSLINIFIVGFMSGLIISFLFYLSTKMTYRTEQDEENERLKTAARMEFIELQETTHSSSRNNEERLDDTF